MKAEKKFLAIQFKKLFIAYNQKLEPEAFTNALDLLHNELKNYVEVLTPAKLNATYHELLTNARYYKSVSVANYMTALNSVIK